MKKKDAGGVEEDDHAREMREAGAHAEEQAHHVKDFKDGDIHLGALPIVQAKAHQANVDAQQLAQAVEEGDYEHEKELAHAEEADADQLDAAVREQEMCFFFLEFFNCFHDSRRTIFKRS